MYNFIICRIIILNKSKYFLNKVKLYLHKTVLAILTVKGYGDR